MILKILNANIVDEEIEWKSFLQKLPLQRQDVFFLPEYVNAYSKEGRGDALCAILIKESAILIYPFLKSLIALDTPSFKNEKFYDIQSPYGYSGPMVNNEGENDDFLEEAWSVFSKWCISNNIVTEFCRYHPFYQNQKWADRNVVNLINRTTIAMDLINYPIDVWEKSHYLNQRGMVRRAIKEGYTFHIEKFSDNISWFTKKYNDTQKKLNADSETFFSELYFNELDKLGDKIWLGVVKENENPLTAVVVIEGVEYAYLHLMAYFHDGPAKGMVNYLYHETAIEASKNDKKLLQVGGGKSNKLEDPLFRFKSRLSPVSHQFYIGKKIYNQEVYNQIVDSYISNYGIDLYNTKKHILQFYNKL